MLGVSPEVIHNRFVSTSHSRLTTTQQACLPFHEESIFNMDKYTHSSAYNDIFDMEDAPNSWKDANISIDDLDDLDNLELELNQRDDSFSLDERHLQTAVAERNTPLSRRRNLLSVSPLKFLDVSPLQMQAVNLPSSYDNNLRKPSLQTRELKVESFPSSPKQEESSFHFNDESAFRKITKPLSPEIPRQNTSHTNGFHSPKNSPVNGFHSPKNSPKNGFHSSQILTPNSQQVDDFASRYLSATPQYDAPSEEEHLEEEYIPKSLSPPSRNFSLSDLELNGGTHSYFDTEHTKRKLFQDSPLKGAEEKSIQHQLKELFDSMEDDDTFSDIVEITSPLLNLSKSFVSLESQTSPYSSPNKSRDSYYSQSTNGSFHSRDNSFNFDTDFHNSSHNYNTSNGITHKHTTNTHQPQTYLPQSHQYQPPPAYRPPVHHQQPQTSQPTYQYQSHQYQNGFHTNKPTRVDNKETKMYDSGKPVQRNPSRELDLMREKQILMEQQQRLENILKSLNLRK